MNLLLFLLFFSILPAKQIDQFPFRESFDAASTLPAGWKTSTNKNAAGDFSIISSTVRSSPNAAYSIDATKHQMLLLPEFNFSERSADSLEFYEKRSSTHNARVLVEAAVGDDTTFSIRISKDSLRSLSGTSYIRRAFALPDTLSGNARVRIRIRIIADTAGSTGTYRVDDVRVTVRKNIDLAASFLSFTPSSPVLRDTVTLRIMIQNRARSGTFTGSVILRDSLLWIAERSFNRHLEVNDSFGVDLQYFPNSAGGRTLTTEIVCSGDEDTLNNSLSLFLNVGVRKRTILVNEILYLPTAGTPEWIELINNSTDTVFLNGWRISDGSGVKAPISSTSGYFPPGALCVITSDTSAVKEQHLKPMMLMHAPIPSLNNSGDAVVLYDQTMTAIDSLSYLSTWGGAPGRTLERRETVGGSTDPSNWGTSSVAGGTPGKINSITPKLYDAAVVRITSSPASPSAGKIFEMIISIRNIGKEDLLNGTVYLCMDVNADSLITEDERIRNTAVPILRRGDSSDVRFVLPAMKQGEFRFGAVFHCSADEDMLNDVILFTLGIGPLPQSIVINEIMAVPEGDIPEWIECYNRSTDTVDISGWKVSDNGTVKAALSGKRTTIPPREFFIITTDTSQFISVYGIPSRIVQAPFPGLNNTTPDAVVLINKQNETMDSIHYRPTWHGAIGTTLQRFDSEIFGTDSVNWRSAAASPGTNNPSSRKEHDAEITAAEGRRTEAGIAFSIAVRNIGRTSLIGASVIIRSVGVAEGMIASLAVPVLAPMDSIRFFYEWRTVPSGSSRISVQCLLDEDERPENNERIVSVAVEYPERTLVINEILYDPADGGAEFVELYNRSMDTVSAEGWVLLDQSGSLGNRTSFTMKDSSLRIPPGGFIAVASDTVIFTFFPGLDRRRTVIHPSLSLSNSGEDIILRDITGKEIDSVRYSPEWHLQTIAGTGRSLERINPFLESTDGKNWSTSVATAGASPLRSNSIFTSAAASGSAISLSPNPFSPDNDGYEDFLSVNYVLPALSSMIRIRIFDVTGRLIRRLVRNEPASSRGSVIWNGLDDDGRRVRMGMYIILLEALDHFGGTVRVMKDVAVAARRL